MKCLAKAFIPFFLLLPFLSVTQTKVIGLVMDSKMQPVFGANVLLVKSVDTSLVKGASTAKDGLFAFDNIKAGNYLVLATAVGFANVYLPAFSIGNNPGHLDLKTIRLAEVAANLGEVTVQTRKPLLEQKIDRLVINVKNSITSVGLTALDVLERSPGVIVNRQANSITMSGKEGVMVMINGKINYMPVSALVQMLAGMNAGNIDKIELITTPPAGLDAQGNAGYINIVLATNPDFGFNGSFSSSVGYGRGGRQATSINFNYRKNKVNFFGDYSFLLDKRPPFLNNYRRVANQGDVFEAYTKIEREPTRLLQNIRLGLDYQLNKKTVLGFLLAGYINRYSMHEKITNNNYKNYQRDTIVVINNKEVNNWRHAMGNVNLQHTIKPGEMLSFDIDYLFYSNRQPFAYENNYFNSNEQFLFTQNVRTQKLTPIKFGVAKVDYSKQTTEKSSIEVGIKATVSRFDNDVKVERLENNLWQIDQDYTSYATLKENITAAYLAYNINFNSLTTLKMGLRYEYTNSNLGTVLQKNIVDRHYGNLFPSLFISRKISELKSINFSYSRRINRPTFNDLAPFIFFFDPNTFISGNAALQPSISDNVKADYTFKQMLFSLSYSYDNNSIAGFQSKIDPKTNKQVFFAENMNFLRTVSMVVALPVVIKKWWNVQNNLTGTWQQASGTLDNAPFEIKLANVNMRMMQNFLLPKNYSVELAGVYQSSSIFGRFKVKPYGQVDVGIQKKFKTKNQRLNLAVTDVFSTYKWVWVTNVESLNFSRTSLQFTRATINLTYSRNFGSNTVKASRGRNTGSAEESKRVN